jgi:DNA-binding NarL/FixJ family response regulator
MHERSARITILLADDQPLFREALKKLLENDLCARIIGEAKNGRDAVRMTRELRPDILLMDLHMPEVSGLAALRELATVTPPVRTVLFTEQVADDEVIEAVQLGVRGILMKHSTAEQLFECLHTVSSGGYSLGHECVASLIENVRGRDSQRNTAARQPAFGLTPRQLDIVSAIVGGATNDDVARQFSISTTTVKYHLTNVFDKLGVSNRIELARFAVEHRLDAMRQNA